MAQNMNNNNILIVYCDDDCDEDTYNSDNDDCIGE